jgi:hypothetical protein
MYIARTPSRTSGLSNGILFDTCIIPRMMIRFVLHSKDHNQHMFRQVKKSLPVVGRHRVATAFKDKRGVCIHLRVEGHGEEMAQAVILEKRRRRTRREKDCLAGEKVLRWEVDKENSHAARNLLNFFLVHLQIGQIATTVTWAGTNWKPPSSVSPFRPFRPFSSSF